MNNIASYGPFPYSYHGVLKIVAALTALLLSAPEAWANDEVSSERVCSYFDVLTELNISKGNELYTMTRPILDYRNRTIVHLEIALYGILGMVSVCVCVFVHVCAYKH